MRFEITPPIPTLLLRSLLDFKGYTDNYAVNQTYFDDTLSAKLSPGKKVKKTLVYFEDPKDLLRVLSQNISQFLGIKESNIYSKIRYRPYCE